MGRCHCARLLDLGNETKLEVHTASSVVKRPRRLFPAGELVRAVLRATKRSIDGWSMGAEVKGCHNGTA